MEPFCDKAILSKDVEFFIKQMNQRPSLSILIKTDQTHFDKLAHDLYFSW